MQAEDTVQAESRTRTGKGTLEAAVCLQWRPPGKSALSLPKASPPGPACQGFAGFVQVVGWKEMWLPF